MSHMSICWDFQYSFECVAPLSLPAFVELQRVVAHVKKIVRIQTMTKPIMDLISHLHLSWKRRITRDLAPYGVNPKQIFLLRRLDESEGIAPSEIAELLYADRPSITSMLGTMERMGWIERAKDARDGRRLLVRITAQGRATLASVPKPLWRSGKTAFDPTASLTPEERSELTRLLGKLAQAFEQDNDNE